MKIKIGIILFTFLALLSINCYSENSERVLDKSRVHSVGNLELRVSNFGILGSNGAEWPSLEYPANSGIDRLKVASLWFGAKKVRRDVNGQRLFWLHWPPLDAQDIVPENDPNWTPDLHLVVDTLTTVGYDGDLDVYELLPAYNPLETGIPSAQYQQFDSQDIVMEASTSDQLKGYDDDGDGMIDEDPAGMAFPFRASEELPIVFEDYGGMWLSDLNNDEFGPVIEYNDIWFPLEYSDLAHDPSNGIYCYTLGFDDDCDMLTDEDGFPLSEQDFIAYYYDYSPFGTQGDRDYGSSSGASNHYPLNIAVRQMSYQWSNSYLADITFLEFSITNMNSEDVLYDCAAGLFVDAEVGPQDWIEENRKNDDVSSYVTGSGYEFPFSRDFDGDAGLSSGYVGTMLCSPNPADLSMSCWTWDIGDGPDDTDPRSFNPPSGAASHNDKYWLLTNYGNPNDDKYISLRDFPNAQMNSGGLNTRYLYGFYGAQEHTGDSDGNGVPDYMETDDVGNYYKRWNIEPLKTMKIVIALFAGGDNYNSMLSQAAWVRSVYGSPQSLFGSSLPDTLSHYLSAIPPESPCLLAEKSENDTDIELYWDNRSEIDNIDTKVVNIVFIGWQDNLAYLDSYIGNWDESIFPTEFAPYYWDEYSQAYDFSMPVNRNNNALVNPWTGYRLRHDFQGYTIWGKPESMANDQWIQYGRFDKIETEQDYSDYMVNSGTPQYIDFGGDLDIDTGLPNGHIITEEDLNYYHFNDLYNLVPYSQEDLNNQVMVYGYPLYDWQMDYETASNLAVGLSFNDQVLLFKHPSIPDDLYLELYDDRLIPLLGHQGQYVINNSDKLEKLRKHRLSRRYYHDTIINYPSEERFCVSVTAWDRGMPSINILPLESGKWENTLIISTLPNDFLIWPGDTNLDGTVDVNDIDAIAVYFRTEGDARDSVSFEWNGYEIPENWEIREATLADCNGDGEVNITDVLAICINWEKSHTGAADIVSFSEEDYIANKNNFMELYESLGDSDIEIRLKNHIADIFDLPQEEIFVNALHNNYPNPFNPTTVIRYSVSTKSDIELSIYNIRGQVVKRFRENDQDAGNYSIIWDGLNLNNNKVSCGVYFYKLVINGNLIDTKKMVLIKEI
ncbi:MAG: T9SS type A sorting domain-containing protein [Candidatus Cloacimonetes bacterium]|nr:T9SS type A sorting domain-containing protein [Candidatus Cloacimonadota bacterium]